MIPVEPPLRILVADDDAILREIARATLEAAGFSVQVVASGDAAVAACALRLPDIALLDVEMPPGNGYQACANIRVLPGGATLPIVMVTGLDDPTSIDLAYEAGAYDRAIDHVRAGLPHETESYRRGQLLLWGARAAQSEDPAQAKRWTDELSRLSGPHVEELKVAARTPYRRRPHVNLMMVDAY